MDAAAPSRGVEDAHPMTREVEVYVTGAKRARRSREARGGEASSDARAEKFSVLTLSAF